MPGYDSFEVSPLDVLPRMWRIFALRDTATLHELHEAIQAACGWEHGHMYRFKPVQPGPVIAGIPDESGFSERAPEAKRVALAAHFGREVSTHCLYEYDFGDGSMREVVMPEIVDRAGRSKRILLGGDRAFSSRIRADRRVTGVALPR